nr:MAG TPA: hypothetical protein [Bacteriophage sp.]
MKTTIPEIGKYIISLMMGNQLLRDVMMITSKKAFQINIK